MCGWLKRRKRSKKGRGKHTNTVITCKLERSTATEPLKEKSPEKGPRHKSNAISMTPSTLNDLPSTSVDSIQLPEGQLKPVEESHVFAWRDRRTKIMKIKKVQRTFQKGETNVEQGQEVRSNLIKRISRIPSQLVQIKSQVKSAIKSLKGPEQAPTVTIKPNPTTLPVLSAGIHSSHATIPTQ